jgi:hypothetical protein
MGHGFYFQGWVASSVGANSRALSALIPKPASDHLLVSLDWRNFIIAIEGDK